MKKIEKLKLTAISKNELEERQMKMLKGGYGDCDNPGCCKEDAACTCGTRTPANSDSSSFWREQY